MQQAAPLTEEPRLEGVREVSVMAGPIVVGAMSFVAMDFADKYMVSRLGTDSLAAIGSASLWAYVLAVVVLGTVGCVSTFVSQSIGRGAKDDASVYAWQGFYISLGAGALALCLWPVSPVLFNLMHHSPHVTQQELDYFQVRLLGYLPIAWATALGAFFQGVNRAAVSMYAVVVANIANIVVNYALIYGKWGAPALGVEGAAWGTTAAQYLQALVLFGIFLLPGFHRQYQTRSMWRFDAARFRELLRIGVPAGVSQMLDVATWGIFISFVVGRFGDVALAANNAAVAIMHISFIPAIGLNQAIAPIVGQWIGRGDIERAKARTYTALKLGSSYMVVMGIIFAVFGGNIVQILTQDPEVIRLGWQMLIMAALFQFSDCTGIVMMGALRGAGDTRWVMFATLVGAYCCFLPLATFLAMVYPGGPAWAWVGASAYIIVLGAVLFWRFRSERWTQIQIFNEESKLPPALQPAPEAG